MRLIERNIARITELCHLHKVKDLCVFGSILTDRFTDQSDVDFLVNFHSDHNDLDYVENYFALKEALEHLFNRQVDLLEEKGLRNKYLIRNVNRTKRLVYG